MPEVNDSTMMWPFVEMLDGVLCGLVIELIVEVLAAVDLLAALVL